MQHAKSGQSCELHPTDKLFGSDFASCILHPASCTMQRRIHFGADSASCILHSACCTYRVIILGWVLHSAFCICILHFQRNTECRISPSMQRQIHAVCVLDATSFLFSLRASSLLIIQTNGHLPQSHTSHVHTSTVPHPAPARPLAPPCLLGRNLRNLRIHPGPPPRCETSRVNSLSSHCESPVHALHKERRWGDGTARGKDRTNTYGRLTLCVTLPGVSHFPG